MKSNAIVFCGDGMTLGVGAGPDEPRRLVADRLDQGGGAGLSLQGSAVASDAFFPFRDGLDVVVDAGASCVIQPGGSMRDDEVIAAANERDIAMVLHRRASLPPLGDRAPTLSASLPRGGAPGLGGCARAREAARGRRPRSSRSSPASITGAQGHWYGSPPKAEQRIYFANHQSHFDWVLIWAALPHDLRAVTRPIAARDYWTATPLKHWITREIFNAVYVSRERKRRTRIRSSR